MQFWHMNVVNMQRSQSASYTYRRRWRMHPVIIPPGSAPDPRSYFDVHLCETLWCNFIEIRSLHPRSFMLLTCLAESKSDAAVVRCCANIADNADRGACKTNVLCRVEISTNVRQFPAYAPTASATTPNADTFAHVFQDSISAPTANAASVSHLVLVLQLQKVSV